MSGQISPDEHSLHGKGAAFIRRWSRGITRRILLSVSQSCPDTVIKPERRFNEDSSG